VGSRAWICKLAFYRVTRNETKRVSRGGSRVEESASCRSDVRSMGNHALTFQDCYDLLPPHEWRGCFGRCLGGLAVSIVVLLGHFLPARPGIVWRTVVTMGLLALLRFCCGTDYSPELHRRKSPLAGTLGQIIPPSIVIVLLGNIWLVTVYSAAQKARATSAGVTDALTSIWASPWCRCVCGHALFQAALLPRIMLGRCFMRSMPFWCTRC